MYFTVIFKVWTSIFGTAVTVFSTAFNITGLFPNKEKNANYSQSSYYPINAPHFWVYDEQCAFTPQFSPLSKSASYSILGSRPQTPELESLKTKKKKKSSLITAQNSRIFSHH